MPWNGSGIFSRLYNFVEDAANGVKILARKQDEEWNNVVQGLTNTITRDGQTAPTLDINWGGHKITNLANGTAPTDAATVGQMPAGLDEWIRPTQSLTYVSATSFKVQQADFTDKMHPGRRVAILIATPSPYWTYATVVSSTYFAPDTTVVVVLDNTTLPITAGLTNFAVGLVSYSPPSYLSPRTAVSVGATGTLLSVPGNVGVVYQFNTVQVDALGEFSPGGFVFTARYPGNYRVTGCISIRFLAGGATPGVNVYPIVNGVNQPSLFWENVPGTVVINQLLALPFSTMVALGAGGTITIGVSVSFSWASDFTQGHHLVIDRIV